MSELKYYKLFHRASALTSPNFISVAEFGTNEEVYLKSEADKVIAELKAKLQNVSEILKETREWLIDSQKLHKRCADNAVKVIRHQKYKRCLAMANYWVAISYHCIDDKHSQRAEKRHYKWLKLAEKFKEAK